MKAVVLGLVLVVFASVHQSVTGLVTDGAVVACSFNDTKLFADTIDTEGDDLCFKGSDNATAYNDCWVSKGLNETCTDCLEDYFTGLKTCQGNSDLDKCVEGANALAFCFTGKTFNNGGVTMEMFSFTTVCVTLFALFVRQ